MAKGKQEFVKFTTPSFVLSYPDLFVAKQFKGQGEAKFSLTAMFPKKTTDMKVLKKQIKRAANDFFGAKKPHGFRDPIKDGDEMTNDDGDPIEANKGYWIVRFATKRAPGIVDKDRNILTEADADELYPGCICRLTGNAYAYDNINKGVSFGLNNVQKLKDGDPLVSRNDPSDDFNDDSDEDSDDGDSW